MAYNSLISRVNFSYTSRQLPFFIFIYHLFLFPKPLSMLLHTLLRMLIILSSSALMFWLKAKIFNFSYLQIISTYTYFATFATTVPELLTITVFLLKVLQIAVNCINYIMPFWECFLE